MDLNSAVSAHWALAGELPERERRVVSKYRSEVPVKDIADELGVSSGRICQIRDEAVGVLRSRMAASPPGG